MARTKRRRRSYGAGEWGRNRVRVFPDPKTGLFQIEWRDNGRRLSRSLKHRDWARAKRQADEFAAGFAEPELGSGAQTGTASRPRSPSGTGTGSSGQDGRAGSARAASPYPIERSNMT